eukprot:1957177-Karenia_brevis.AAC.1
MSGNGHVSPNPTGMYGNVQARIQKSYDVALTVDPTESKNHQRDPTVEECSSMSIASPPSYKTLGT